MNTLLIGSHHKNPTTGVYKDVKTRKAHGISNVNELLTQYQYLHADILLNQWCGHMQANRVVGRASDTNGKPSDQYDDNTILNNQIYDFMFPDGSIG